MLRDSDSENARKSFIKEEGSLIDFDKLQIAVNQLTFQDETGGFPKRHDSLCFFIDFIDQYGFPPEEILVQLDHFIFILVQQENPPDVKIAILTLINQISRSFKDLSSDTDSSINFNSLISFIWGMLNSDEAFEALANVSCNNFEAAQILVSQLGNILSWITVPETTTNGLIVVESLISHMRDSISLAGYFIPHINFFLDLTQKLNDVDLQILYSILRYYISTQEGFESVKNYPMINNLFDRALENQDVFLSALKFLQPLVRRLKNPMEFMENCNILNFFEKSLNSGNNRIILEGIGLCFVLYDDIPAIQFMLGNGIIDRLFSLTSSTQKISSKALRTICQITSGAPNELVTQFLDKGIMDLINLFYPVSENKYEMLVCLQTIYGLFRENGNAEEFGDLISEEVVESLMETKQSDDDQQIGHIATLIYSYIYPPDI